jgi:hypothetical protein
MKENVCDILHVQCTSHSNFGKGFFTATKLFMYVFPDVIFSQLCNVRSWCRLDVAYSVDEM